MLYALSDPTPGVAMRSGFGWRIHPITKKRTFHNGIDYGGVFDVMAAGDGVVVHVAPEWNALGAAAKRRQSGGNVVIIQHASDCFTAYYHGAYKSPLKVGQRVKTGDVIYRSGSTGLSTGNHLHFEVRTKQSGNQVDPVPYLRSSNAPQTPNVVQVTGRLDKNTWRAWQEVLRKYGYDGIIDGVPGARTHRAIQRSVGQPESGILTDATKKAVQTKLGVKADGNWGPVTISALQRALNAGTY